MRIRNHFQNGSPIIRISQKSFDKHKSLCRRFVGKEYNLALIVYHIQNDPNIWLGDIRETPEFWKWYGFISALEYNVAKELKELDTTPRDAIIINGNNCSLFDSYYYGNVSKETVCILDQMYNFFPYWRSSGTYIMNLELDNMEIYSKYLKARKEVLTKELQKYDIRL